MQDGGGAQKVLVNARGIQVVCDERILANGDFLRRVRKRLNKEEIR